MNSIIVDTSLSDKLYYCGNKAPYHSWSKDIDKATLFNKRDAKKLVIYNRKREHWLSQGIKIEEVPL